MKVWKTGDQAILVYCDRTVSATVTLASGDGRSLVLAFDARLGGYVGMMPVLWNDDEHCFLDLITHAPVSLSDFPPSAVHVLREGAALCGMPGVPASWPGQHRWVRWDDRRAGDVTCAACLGLRAHDRSGIAETPRVAGSAGFSTPSS